MDCVLQGSSKNNRFTVNSLAEESQYETQADEHGTEDDENGEKGKCL